MAAEMSNEFVSLQLRLVDRYVELGLGSVAQGAHRLTNFQRRLGLGAATDPATDERWNDILRRLEGAPTHEDRVAAVMSAYQSLPPAVPEHLVHQWPTVGAFSIQVIGPVARTHFYSTDSDDLSPFHESKLSTRAEELRAVLGSVLRDPQGAGRPRIERVAGGSWLYSTASYRSLFPHEHTAHAVVRRGRSTFRGMSHWGQFLDFRGRIRDRPAAEFRRRVAAWTGGDPCELFPIDTLEVDSPVEMFEEFRAGA